MFYTMRPSDIAKKIQLAKKRVVFMAPRLDSSIASALVKRIFGVRVNTHDG